MDASFEVYAEKLAKWVANYRRTIEQHPVRAQVQPGDIAARLPKTAPAAPESFDNLLMDLDDVILPGITHWQHPRFFAYFPANVMPESVLADFVVSGLGVNSLLWQTSPAASELEEVMCNWLRDAMGLPRHWQGVIQDTASSATFSAVVTAREHALDGAGNRDGLSGQPPLAVYVSAEAHSSIEKAVRMAGLGSAALRIIQTDDDRAMDRIALKNAIEKDLADGVIPALLVVTAGGTGTGAFDRADELISIAKQYRIYTHVDAAWAGAALICEDFRAPMAGVEQADSFVFNPHKWLGIGFDCSIQFLSDPKVQIDALSVKPHYLKSAVPVNDYSDWSPVLGRRMRAMKIWFVLRLVGLDRLRTMIRNHVNWAQRLADIVADTPGFEIVTDPRLALFTFRYGTDEQTQNLTRAINDDGFTYVTETMVDGRPAIRFSIGAATTDWQDVIAAFTQIRTLAARR